ncbi:MAG: type I secretion C-terminal target domain-containing protein, partial [Gammaproteobacteria bacterium]
GTTDTLSNLIELALDNNQSAIEELNNYFSITSDGSETVISIDSGGGDPVGQADQIITLEGVDTTGMELATVLNNLINPPEPTV